MGWQSRISGLPSLACHLCMVCHLWPAISRLPFQACHLGPAIGPVSVRNEFILVLQWIAFRHGTKQFAMSGFREPRILAYPLLPRRCANVHYMSELTFEQANIGRSEHWPVGTLAGRNIGRSEQRPVGTLAGRNIGRSEHRPVGTLAGQNIGRSEHWPVGTLAGRNIGRSEHWPVGTLAGQNIGRSEHWSVWTFAGRNIGRSKHWPVGTLAGWNIDRLEHWPVGILAGWNTAHKERFERSLHLCLTMPGIELTVRHSERHRMREKRGSIVRCGSKKVWWNTIVKGGHWGSIVRCGSIARWLLRLNR